MDRWSRPAFFVGETEMDQISPMSLDGLDPIEEPPEDDARKIILGICAMAKKSRSQPMKEILDRLECFPYIQVEIFDEQVILNDPVEKWPICDCLISFYSKGFCLDKAIAYEKLRKPYVLNDLPMQYALQDRRAVYSTLMENNIDHPRYAVCEQLDEQVIEADDQIEVDGVVFQKPFVEKPVSAEDHNVYIYFPTSAGGGSQRLFRKIGSRSSVYSPVSRIRKTGDFIYEDFMPTDGTDVKVYTLGPDYAHAEARKSPALDGKVERDKNGKEVRYPVILTAREKMIARMVCIAFKQTICGFDLLRANGKSFVCDVNGFSFVKNSMKYYDDCAKIIGNMVMRFLAPQFSIPWSIACQPEDIPIVPTTYGTMMELRSVIAVIRHGDRTPKQKMKMEVKHQKFFDLFAKYDGYAAGHLKLKRPKQLQEVLDIARSLLTDLNNQADPEIEEKKSKLEQLKSVLEMYGHFSGINRKVQLKYQPNGRPKKSSSDDESPGEPSLVLILKWGGELTPAGKIQAEELGKAFRCMYPGGEGDYEQPGLGLLRLHSTFRHDLKIYASDEGRVQMTAAAFAKGLLALEGELTPILVQMVKSANTNGLLDNEPTNLSDYQNMAKQQLCDMFHQDREFTQDDYIKLAPTNSPSLINAMKFIKNPFAVLTRVNDLIRDLTERIRTVKTDPESRDAKLYHGETWELMMRRWSKLEKDFKMKNGRFDITKIPDIYDCIKYDLQHNQTILNFEQGNELHTCSRALADLVVPQEYGISEAEKVQIALSICTPLLTKIKCDLARNIGEDSTRLDARYSKGVSTPHRHVRTRLYFTSESHIHSLLTLIRYGGLCDVTVDAQWKRAMDYVGAISELNYMTQIVIMMYEDPNKDAGSEERFHVELHFSPGAQTFDTDKNYPPGFGYRPQQVCTPRGKSPVAASDASDCPTDERFVEPDDLSESMEDEASSQLETSAEMETEIEEDVSGSRETLKAPSTDNLVTDESGAVGAGKRRSTSPISIENNRSKSRHKSADDLGVGERRKNTGQRNLKAADTTSESTARSQSFEEKPNFNDRPATIMEGFKRDVPSAPDQEEASPGSSGTLIGQQSARRFSTSAAIGSGVIQQALMDGHQTRLSDLLYLPGLMANHRHSFASLFANAFGEVKGSNEPVPAIRPLETLHNSLTLKQVEGFIDSLLIKLACDEGKGHESGGGYSGQVGVKRGRCIPLSSAYSLSSSTNSSGGPPSPSSMPDDAALKLRLLMEATRQHSMDFDSALMSPDMFSLRDALQAEYSDSLPASSNSLPSSSSLPSTPGDRATSPRMARSKSSENEGQAERHSSDFER